ncbi:holin [Paenibacillus pinisoli]|uniref:Holin n=1 Tax=Paenibacillus pinisoli TaxID=1276110 RepID=A0A3A6PJW3_9BACL|nr:phage holin family protein [Paenibacillus pinisoli]RJX40036.1 holin [Paenibacillus pinisoli]
MNNEIIQFITEQALVLMPVLFVIGLLLKNTPWLADWAIPWVLLVLGVTGGILIVGDALQGIIQGILVTGATVLTHQLVKQTLSKN